MVSKNRVLLKNSATWKSVKLLYSLLSQREDILHTRGACWKVLEPKEPRVLCPIHTACELSLRQSVMTFSNSVVKEIEADRISLCHDIEKENIYVIYASGRYECFLFYYLLSRFFNNPADCRRLNSHRPTWWNSTVRLRRRWRCELGMRGVKARFHHSVAAAVLPFCRYQIP